jgi:hypothetical protein
MRCFEPVYTTDAAGASAPSRMVTTLYELIEMLHAQVLPGEDDLVIAAMQNIINTRRLAFMDLEHAHRLKCA